MIDFRILWERADLGKRDQLGRSRSLEGGIAPIDHMKSLTQSLWADSHLWGLLPSFWWELLVLIKIVVFPSLCLASQFRVNLWLWLSVCQPPPDLYLSLRVRDPPGLCCLHTHFLTSGLQLSLPVSILFFLQLSLQFLVWADLLHSRTYNSPSTPWNTLRDTPTLPLPWDLHNICF